MPPAKQAIDARTDTILGAPVLPAIPIPRKAMFPVINAVKTFPRARKLIASTAPDETVSASSSQLRTLTSLIWRSTVATGDVTDLVLIVGSSQFGTSLYARSSDQDDRAVLLAAGANTTAQQMTTLRRPAAEAQRSPACPCAMRPSSADPGSGAPA